MDKKFLWVEEYRPHKIDDCILPVNILNVFKGFVEQGELPNLLLPGTAGIGKTTVAKALCEEIGVDCRFLKCSHAALATERLHHI